MDLAIRVDDLTKLYPRHAGRRRFSTLKSAILRGTLLTDLGPGETFTALDRVGFSVRPGTTVAVIGPNGSGKSTLLKILAGVLQPTSGTVEVRGRVAALLELGAGFHPEVSGRDNVIINGIMLGLSRKEIEARLPDIVAFSDLADFIDAPVKTYSSGMYVRLAFSVAVAVEPDVLLADEVLAVGDESFSHRCLDRFRDLKRRGRTVVLVTHSLDLAEALVDEVLLIEGGRLSARGMPREVIDRYRGHVEARESQNLAAANAELEVERREEGSGAEPPPAPAGEGEAAGGAAPGLPDSWQPRRWGNRLIEFTSIGLSGPDGAPRALFHTGEPMQIELEVVAHEAQTDFDFGVAIFGRNGQMAYGSNMRIEGIVPRRLEGASRIRVEFTDLALLDGTYSLDVAVCKVDGAPYDYRHACLTFTVRSPIKDVGVARLAHAWHFEDGVVVAAPPVGAPSTASAEAELDRR